MDPRNWPSMVANERQGMDGGETWEWEREGPLLHRFPRPQIGASAQKGTQRVIRWPVERSAWLWRLAANCKTILVRNLPAGLRVGFLLHEWLSRTKMLGLDAVENCAVLAVESAQREPRREHFLIWNQKAQGERPCSIRGRDCRGGGGAWGPLCARLVEPGTADRLSSVVAGTRHRRNRTQTGKELQAGGTWVGGASPKSDWPLLWRAMQKCGELPAWWAVEGFRVGGKTPKPMELDSPIRLTVPRMAVTSSDSLRARPLSHDQRQRAVLVLKE